MNTFPIKIVTPKGEFYSGEIEYLSLETPDGKIGIMRGALPRVAVLSPGIMEIKTSVLSLRAQTSGGMFLVDGGVTVLSEECVFEGDTPNEAEDGGDRSEREYKAAKVRISAAFKNMRDKSGGT